MKQHKVHGFTLIELMVVVGIIGVLSAVLIPSMNAYYTRSRIKTTNSNAKVLFNAAQTLAQEYQFRERSISDHSFNSTSDGVVVIRADGGNIVSVNDTPIASVGGVADPSDPSKDLISAADRQATYTDFVQRIGDIFGDSRETCWIVYVDNYIVRSAVCARTATDRYLGAYPNPTDEKADITISGMTRGSMFTDYVQPYWGGGTPTATE